MLILVVERATPKIRGFLSSWCLQVATGVYVANLPQAIREKIWSQLEEWASTEMAAVLLWTRGDSEQGLRFLQRGTPRRRLVEIEGLIVSTWLAQEEESR